MHKRSYSNIRVHKHMSHIATQQAVSPGQRCLRNGVSNITIGLLCSFKSQWTEDRKEPGRGQEKWQASGN